MSWARWLLLGALAGSGCASAQPAPRRTTVVAAPAEEAAAVPAAIQPPEGELPGRDEPRSEDGRDLIETPEQRYARLHGSCDFRDASQPSPLEGYENLTKIVIDLRDPRELRSTAGWTRRDAPERYAALVRKLGKRDAGLSACTAGLPASTTPIGVGASLSFRLVPQSGPGPRLAVELGRTFDSSLTQCLLQRLRTLLADVRIDEPVQVALIVPDATFPKELIAEAPLDKDVVRRVIHQHIDEVRVCYEDALAVWPELQSGRVAIRFAIESAGGRVLDAQVANDELGNPPLACCIARHVYAWQFPGNGNKGFTIVTYPFVLEAVTEDAQQP